MLTISGSSTERRAEELAKHLTGDDMVTPFEVKPLAVRGRIARLGGSVTAMLARHGYPDAVSAVLAEAAGLTALLGTTLKFEGKFILQTRTDGPIDMLVVDFVTPGDLRGYAHFDESRLNAALTAGQSGSDALLGKGNMVMTIDQGADMDRYQGIVALDGGSLADAAHAYFLQSEQIPTSVRLAAGPVYSKGSKGQAEWRAGGIMVQHLPDTGPASPLALSSGDAPEGADLPGVQESDDWTRARILMQTVEDHELLDPSLTSDRLLYRLYHEDGVTAYEPRRIAHNCHCSRERILAVLDGFSAAEIAETAKDGKVNVTCEFCSASYQFDVGEISGS